MVAIEVTMLKRLNYLRNRYRHAGFRLAGRKFEVFNTAPATLHIWKQVNDLEEAIDLANQLVVQHPESIFNVWSPDHEHAYQVANEGGKLEVKKVPQKHVEQQMEEDLRKTGSFKLLVDGAVYRKAAEPVDDIGFDGFIGVFDPDKEKKRDYAEKMLDLRSLRKTIPVVVDEDVMPVHGGTRTA